MIWSVWTKASSSMIPSSTFIFSKWTVLVEVRLLPCSFFLHIGISITKSSPKRIVNAPICSIHSFTLGWHAKATMIFPIFRKSSSLFRMCSGCAILFQSCWTALWSEWKDGCVTLMSSPKTSSSSRSTKRPIGTLSSFNIITMCKPRAIWSATTKMLMVRRMSNRLGYLIALFRWFCAIQKEENSVERRE